MTATPAFWIAYTLLALACARRRVAALPARHSARQSRHQDDARGRRSRRRKRSPPRQAGARGARSAVVSTHDDVTQSYVELEGGGKPAFARLVAGNVYAPYWWEVRLFKPGDIEEVTDALPARRRASRFRAAGRRRPTCAIRRRRHFRRGGARSRARTRAQRGLERRFRALQLLEQSQQMRPSGRVDHQVRVRARRRARRGTDPAAARRVPATSSRRWSLSSTSPRASSGASRKCAARTTRSPASRVVARHALRLVGLHPRRAVVCCASIGSSGSRASSPGSSSARWLAAALLANAQRVVRVFHRAGRGNFWVRQVGLALARVPWRRARARCSVHGGGRLDAPRVSAIIRRLWRLWSRDAARDARGRRTHRRRLSLRSRPAGADRAFYCVTNRWLGWWQPSEQLTDPNICRRRCPR